MGEGPPNYRLLLIAEKEKWARDNRSIADAKRFQICKRWQGADIRNYMHYIPVDIEVLGQVEESEQDLLFIRPFVLNVWMNIPSFKSPIAAEVKGAVYTKIAPPPLKELSSVGADPLVQWYRYHRPV